MKVDKDDFSFITVYIWSMEAVVSFSFTTDVCVLQAFSQKSWLLKNIFQNSEGRAILLAGG